MNARTLTVVSGRISRREMLGALARWSAPTVLTMFLATRRAAAISCPPCTRAKGNSCHSCNTNQILNCQCEPCLGPPQCAAASRAGAMASPGVMSAPPSGPLQGGGASPLATPTSPDLTNPFYRTLHRQQSYLHANPFDARALSPFRNPLGAANPYGGSANAPLKSGGGLFERLRPDSRRPF